jgi:hypothetical protein
MLCWGKVVIQMVLSSVIIQRMCLICMSTDCYFHPCECQNFAMYRILELPSAQFWSLRASFTSMLTWLPSETRKFKPDCPWRSSKWGFLFKKCCSVKFWKRNWSYKLAKLGLLAEGEPVLSLWNIFIMLPKSFLFMQRIKIERSNKTHKHISCHFMFIAVPSLVWSCKLFKGVFCSYF